MNTPNASLAYDGVLDVSIVIPTLFENPLKEDSVTFMADALSLKRRIILPVTAIIGAYHIGTRYLRISRVDVNRVLEELLRTRSPALYPNVAPEAAIEALHYATSYNIESWDGYLIALARGLQTKIIYSLDEELGKIREVTVVNPFPKDKVREYHSYIKAKTEEARSRL